MTHQNDGWTADTSPFHAGEQAAQERAGVRDKMEAFGRKVIRPFMPEQHRSFFEGLPFLAVGHVDAQGWPWATLLAGPQGFVKSPNPEALRISSRPHTDDPLSKGLNSGAPVGLLGLDFAARRRNRLNAHISQTSGDGFEVSVDQSFGNCPQYIQTRSFDFIKDPKQTAQTQGTFINELDEAAVRMIEQADTFFVASAVSEDKNPKVEGVDVSHRGGKPGFVRVRSNELTIPDFSGNFHFNTLGNFLINPKAGLVFVDFESGDMLLLTGTVKINWDGPEVDAFEGAQRTWSFYLDHGVRLKGALPLRWTFGAFSTNSLDKGDWREADKVLTAQRAREAWRPYRVVHIEDESDVIRSFYLAPEDGGPNFSFEAGQYLTVKVLPTGSEKPVVRTYTLSSEPGSELYRISIKREAGVEGERPAGVMSTWMHGHIKPGDIIEAKAPQGHFYIDPCVKRPAVLLAGGVGITPMISMAAHVARVGKENGRVRPLTLIHSAQKTSQRAFFNEARSLVKMTDGVIQYVSLIDVPERRDIAGITYDASGRITVDILQNHLALDDYDFFLCGPPPFMQGLYNTLRELGVRDGRILAEAFGPASLKRTPDEPASGEVIESPSAEAPAQSATVRFESSKFEQRWSSAEGTLLELAENHGLSPDYGCRSGACGSCSVKVLSGAVSYRSLPSSKVREGDALICCAVPAANSGDLVLDL